MAVERKYRITFEGSDQQISKLGKLEQQLTEVNEELKEQKRILKESKGTNSQAAESVARLSQEQKRLRGESSKVSREVQTQDKAIKANSKTIEGMRRKVSDLTRQWAKAEIGTEEFKQLERQLDATTKELKEYEGKANKFQRNVGNYKSGLDGLKKGFMGVAAGITVAIGVFGSLGVNASNVIDTYAENERAQRSMQVALGKTSELLKRQADEMGYLAEGGETAILTQQAFLASLGFSEDRIQEVINAAVDLSAATGKDLDFAVRNLSKTYSGLTGELGELIPELKNFTSEELKAGAATEFATEQFAGQARAISEVGTGQFNRFNEVVSDLNNNLGRGAVNTFGALADIAADLGEVFVELTNKTERESDAVKTLNSRFNIEINTLKKLKPGTENRDRLIKSINTTYKDYLPALLTENSTLEDIEAAQRGANDAFRQKIILLAAEEELREVAQKQLRNELKALELELRMSAQQAAISEARIGSAERASNSLSGIDTQLSDAEQNLNQTTGAITANKEEAAKLAAEYEKVSLAAEKLGLSVESVVNATPDITPTPTGEPTGERGGESIEQIDPFEAPEVIRAREVGAILVGVEDDTQEAIRKSKEETYAFEEEMRIARKKAELQEAALKLNLASTVFHGVAALLKQGSKEAKALALIGIAIDTAKGIASATAAGAGIPFPGNLPAITTGVGVVLGNMAAAKNVLKGNNEDGGILEKFATGGVLKGKRHSQGGIQMFGRGGYFGEAEGGEAIINRRSTAMFKPVLSALNAAGGGRTFANGGELGRPQLPTSFGSLFNSDEFVDGIVNGINAKQVFLNMTDVNSFQSDIQLTETEVSF